MTDLKSPPQAALASDSPPGNRALLISFITERRARGLNSGTCEFYHGYLTRFLNGVDKPLLAVIKEDIASFMESLQCNPGGKHAYFRSVRAFYKWAEAEGLIADVPRIVGPKVPKPLRYAVRVHDISNCWTPQTVCVTSLLCRC